MQNRNPHLAWKVVLIFVVVSSLSSPSFGTTKFLQNSSQSSVTSILKAWTQDDACFCCVCWETALCTVYAYWDDNTFNGQGPWEALLPGGSGWGPVSFEACTQNLYDLFSDNGYGGCHDGASWSGFLSNGSYYTIAEMYTDDVLGGSFNHDLDDWVWFGNDIADEIDDAKPVLYVFTGKMTETGSTIGGHAITIVGYDDSDDLLYTYFNWYETVTIQGFDDATEHEVLDITPGGTMATQLTTFEAFIVDDEVELRWVTSKDDTAGWQIRRSTPSETGPSDPLPPGLGNYLWFDPKPAQEIVNEYFLQALMPSGQMKTYGPVWALPTAADIDSSGRVDGLDLISRSRGLGAAEEAPSGFSLFGVHTTSSASASSISPVKPDENSFWL